MLYISDNHCRFNNSWLESDCLYGHLREICVSTHCVCGFVFWYQGSDFPIRMYQCWIQHGGLCALEEVFTAFIIPNHFTMLHPSFCQHANVLDLYNLGWERKVRRTKQSVAFTTCNYLYRPPFWLWPLFGDNLWKLNGRKYVMGWTIPVSRV